MATAVVRVEVGATMPPGFSLIQKHNRGFAPNATVNLIDANGRNVTSEIKYDLGGNYNGEVVKVTATSTNADNGEFRVKHANSEDYMSYIVTVGRIGLKSNVPTAVDLCGESVIFSFWLRSYLPENAKPGTYDDTLTITWTVD
jgi:hypothetical protein